MASAALSHWRRLRAHHRIGIKQRLDDATGAVVLKWIVGSKVDHPLADPKQARALIADLPPHDSVKALEELARWLESLIEVEGFKLDKLFELIELLDTTAKNHHRKVVQDYLAMSRQQKFQENKLWTCGFKFSKALGDAYLYCVQQHDSGAGGIRKQLALIVARALRAFAVQEKWIMLRYGPSEPRLWSAVGQLYRRAENGGYAGSQLTIYPGARGSGTVEQEFLKVLMLWASSADGLAPVEQEIAERTVGHIAGAFRVDKAPFPGALYYFDTALEKSPVRLMGNSASQSATVRYFGPGDASARLAQALPMLEKTGSLPSEISLGAQYPSDLVAGVFRHLCMYWAENPPARASERRATQARITVVPGYFALLDELERDESDALNFAVTNAESWVVENASDNGYGALIPGTTADWIRVGELIGVQIEGSPHWGVGLVRRVSRDEQRRYHVGIEVISRAVHLVKITHEANRDPECAVLLSGSPDQNGEIGMVMRAGRFNPTTSLDITVRDKPFVLVPSRMIDDGDDFDWGLYTVTQAS
jgi:hypothetical protein